ncbi:MAG: ATP-dependent DNA helicase RecG [Rhodospirillaceae bacterium]|nr:ATP-dependent DNA helicase RecG [Rhodospirillaceae bacterium]
MRWTRFWLSDRADTRRSALARPVAALRGVGPRIAERLSRLGVERIADLLCLLPLRYEDRTRIRPLGGLMPGERVLIEGELELAEVAFRRRRSLLCRVADGTGAMTLRFFHFNRVQQQQLVRGARVRCFGDVRNGPTGLEMIHPEYRVIGAEPEPPGTALTPIYPTTEGLHQQRLRKFIQQAMAVMEKTDTVDYLLDRLPEGYPEFGDSIRFLHGPPQGTDIDPLLAGAHPCQRRLALEELVAQRLSLQRLNLGRRREHAVTLKDSRGLLAAFRSQLPFRMTRAQQAALGEILADLAVASPMHRLLQGDVGSGKTVVAAASAVVAASAGYQTAVMVPTELLAEQQNKTIAGWLSPLEVQVRLLTGSVTGSTRKRVVEEIGSGRALVIVGTHALFQQGVRFARLALIIVDEQHRFGVNQRLELKQKGQKGLLSPHQLVMTATPIPRTLTMTAYADLDCSIIDELPPGRQPVGTAVMPQSRRAELVQRVRAHCGGGRQAYWVCPLIEESENLDYQAAAEVGRELADVLPDLNVGLVHGRMSGGEKDHVMREFSSGRLHVLVATTVVEVGVDVPNASLMVIENAERMGLSQLHQLRGRVGRGRDASHCILLYKPPLTDVAEARLRVLRSTTDGFAIAQKDLELRGPGEVLGTRQTGLMHLRVADIVRDADLLPDVIRISDELLTRYPQRVGPLIERWTRGGSEYAKV